MMGLLGFPLLFLTLSLGYFSGKNVVDLWEAVPLFKGNNCLKTRPIIDSSIIVILMYITYLFKLFGIISLQGLDSFNFSLVVLWHGIIQSLVHIPSPTWRTQ